MTTQQIEIQLYHGTSQQSANSIIKDNCIKPSLTGQMGKGIYFTDNIEIAKIIANFKGSQPAVLVCKVKARKDHLRVQTHDPWGGVQQPFKAFCLTDGQVNIQKIITGDQAGQGILLKLEMKKTQIECQQ